MRSFPLQPASSLLKYKPYKLPSITRTISVFKHKRACSDYHRDFLRKYYMLPIMDLHTRTAPSSADRHRVDAIAHPIAQATARAGLREQESQLTQGGYEQMSVHHAAIMDDFVTRIQQRTAEYQQYYQAQQDWGRYHDAARLAEEEMTPLIPRNTNSYVFDPLMVLLYRKPEPTQ